MNSKIQFKSLIFIIIVAISGFHINAQSLLDKRVNDLVDAMTTQEKINQLINCSFGGTPANTRLGIPGFVMDDGPHGVRFAADRNGRSATAFPTGIAMAATWDEALAQCVGEAMGWEFWAFNRNQQLGPCVDICRDPRGGRSAESGGEDAYLAGHIGKSVAIGIQRTPVIATVKHFMGESKQINRHYMDVSVTDRWLMDFSGYNFRTVVQEAGVLSVMASYNKINGDKGCESSKSITTNLRERWGYPFYVVSDWDAIFNSDKALKAGTDICMGSTKYANDLPAMVANGTVTIADLDRTVKHVLRTKILNGMLDYYPRGNAASAKTAEITATNLLATQKSLILLKNGNTADGKAILPLKKTGLKVALIGPNAMGENLNCFGSSETFPPYSISVREGIETKIGAGNVVYSVGCDVNSASKAGFAAAKTAAASADVVIFTGGLDATQEGEGFSTGTDRKGESIALPGQQQQLIKELAAVNPNLVVVIQSGGVCSLNNCISNIKGLVYSFYAGQEAGTAIADVIFGDYNPGGKMPVSMPKNDSDLPSWNEETFRCFTENLDGGYRWFDEKNLTPEFAFGSGLSYTTFSYSNLVLPSSSFAGQPLTVSVDIKNTGNIAGEEVAQLYISSPSTATVWMPKKQLRGFQRVALNAGETKTVTFQLSADDFYYWDGTQYQTQTGNFTIKMGGASDKLTFSKAITITAGEQKPDLKITQIYTMPRYPLKGQKVSFYTLVKNQGNAVTSTNYNIDYKVNGVKVASSDNVSTLIAPGQVQLIASNGEWTTSSIEKSELSGEIALTSGAEWSTTNNSFKRAFEVFDPQLDPTISNLAYQKQVTTSSVFGTNTAASMVDGDYTSRWESGRTDNELATIDLSLIAELTNISIYWEAAYAKSYKVESSLDGTTWTLLKTVTTGNGGAESCAGNLTKARYVRITMLERLPIYGVKYGFSIYEVVVNGNILQQFPVIQLASVESKLYLPYAKTVFNASQSGNPLKPEKLTYRWKQISGPGALIEDSTSAVTLAKFSKVGTYTFKLSVGNAAGSNSTLFTVDVSTPSATADLAFMRPTTCSGVESSFTSPDLAVDGVTTTRWSSNFNDGEWWQIDLQHMVLPSSLNIVWEGAYAKSFNVQISADNKTWQPLYSNSAFGGGTSIIPNDGLLSGRYLKVNCINRATAYGSSFYSFNANGTFALSTNHAPMAKAGKKILTAKDITLNGLLSSDADKDALTYKWEQIAGPSTPTLANSKSAVATVSDLKSGDYFFKLTVDDGKDVDFDVVKVTCITDTCIKSPPENEKVSFQNPVGNHKKRKPLK